MPRFNTVSRRGFLETVGSVAGLAMLPMAAFAQGTDAPTVADLAAAATAAKQQFVPITDARLKRLRSQLAASVARLDRFLSAPGMQTAAWKRYLRWDTLRAATDGAKTVDLDGLNAIHQKFTANHDGLELVVFTDVRDDLRRYLDGVTFAGNPRGREVVGAQLELLAAELEKYAARKDGASARLMGRRLGFLHQARQADKLIAAVRRHYCQPNLHLVR